MNSTRIENVGIGWIGYGFVQEQTRVRMEADTLGCPSESPISDGFMWGIHERLKKKV